MNNNEVILFDGKALYKKDIRLLQFYDEFNSEVTGNGFRAWFYVIGPGSDEESFVAGKTETKTHKRVLELVFTKNKTP